jgi:hypothetical protein
MGRMEPGFVSLDADEALSKVTAPTDAVVFRADRGARIEIDVSHNTNTFVFVQGSERRAICLDKAMTKLLRIMLSHHEGSDRD